MRRRAPEWMRSRYAQSRLARWEHDPGDEDDAEAKRRDLALTELIRLTEEVDGYVVD